MHREENVEYQAFDSPTSPEGCECDDRRQKWIAVGVAIAFLAAFIGSIAAYAHKSSDCPSSTPAPPSNLIQFLHASDLHYDPLFNTSCSKASYCRATSSGCVSAYGTASYGRFFCDSPAQLIQSAVLDMKQRQPNPAFIVITGDFAAHTLPSVSLTVDSIRYISTAFQQQFPGVPVIPTMGNNDLMVDYCVPLNFSVWYDQLLSAWRPWLANSNVADSIQTFEYGGYFASRPVPGLVVLSLNTILYSQSHKSVNCTKTGLTLHQQLKSMEAKKRSRLQAVPTEPAPVGTDPPGLPTDPADQFAWLESNLLSACVRGEKVIIMGHIAPTVNPFSGGINWFDLYRIRYMELVDEYAACVDVQLFGHFHRDELRQFRAPSNSTVTPPSSFAVIGAAVTPNFANNPTYRVFSSTQNGKNYGSVYDYEQFILDLGAANLGQSSSWSRGYGFRDQYQVDLSVSGVSKLLSSISTSSVLAARYIENTFGDHDERTRAYYCGAMFADPSLYTQCVLQYPV